MNKFLLVSRSSLHLHMYKTPFIVLFSVLLFSFSFSAFAELEELDDKKLEEQTGKEGVTIDLSYKLTIGEIAYKFSDDPHAENRNKTLTEPPPRIEYVQGKN